MSRRKQENPQPRKRLIRGSKLEEWLSPLSYEEVDSLPDFLTCGVCQKDFTLADITKFIQHKVNRCNKENYSMCRDLANENSDNDDDVIKDGSAQINSKRPPSISAPISAKKFLACPLSDRNRERRILKPASSSTFLSDDNQLSRNFEDASRRDSDAEDDAKPRQVDANTNTLQSEPSSYVCSKCHRHYTSAWLLLQHVQNEHGIHIYQEKERNGGSSSLDGSNRIGKPSCGLDSSISPSSHHSSSSSGRNIGGRAHDESPRPPSHHHLQQSHLAHPGHPASLVGASPMDAHHAHVAAAAAAAAAAASYNLLPAIAQYPQASVALSNPFNRPSSHDFRFELLNPSASISLPFESSGSSNQMERDSQFDMSRQTPLSLNMDHQQDFYSQRLRQLAGTTSPAIQQSASCPSPRKSTPPFTTPPLQQPPSQSVTPQPCIQVDSPGSKSGSDPNNKQLKSCEYCGKSFRFQSNLVVHRRSHTGEKPYKCRFCNHACSQASKLKRHMKTHFSKNGSPNENMGNASPDSSTKPDDKDDMDANNSGSTCTPDFDDDIMLMEDDELEEEEEEEDEEEEGEFPEKAEDLSTQKSSSPTTSTDSPTYIRPVQKQSLVSEVMEKIGLSGIQQYTEAYKQALEEQNAAGGVVKVKNERPPSVSETSSLHSTANGMFENGISDNHKPKESKFSRIDNSLKGVNNNINHQNMLESGMGFLGAFDSSFDPTKRIKYELSALDSAREREALFPALWVPNPMSHRDFYGMNSVDHNSYRSPSTNESALHFSMSGSGTDGLVSSHKPPTCTPSANPPGTRSKGRNDTCEFCGKVFKNCSNLTVHRRSHTGEKPYKCVLCSYACAQSSKLTRHMKTHGRLGKDVYKCRFCDMPFSVPSTLEKHMRRCATNPERESMDSPPPNSSVRNSKHENHSDDSHSGKDRLLSSPYDVLQTANDLSLKKALLAPQNLMPNNLSKSRNRSISTSGNVNQYVNEDLYKNFDFKNMDASRTNGDHDRIKREDGQRERGKHHRKNSESDHLNSRKYKNTSKDKSDEGRVISKEVNFPEKDSSLNDDVVMEDEENASKCSDLIMNSSVGSSISLLSQISKETATAGNALV